jgi:hypothetical protein
MGVKRQVAAYVEQDLFRLIQKKAEVDDTTVSRVIALILKAAFRKK